MTPDPVTRNNRGLAIIEVLVVIVILGILAAVIVFAVGGLSDAPAHDPVTGRTYPPTRVQVVTDWTDTGGNRSEREIRINGVRCFESIGYTNYGSGLTCDWSPR